MADSVQAILDSMVPPLRDLLDRGIFAESEIRSIIDRRRRYEYLLARRHARKSDFLRYVEDETKLERLCNLRHGRRRRAMAEEEREELERRRELGLAETEEEREAAEQERERRWKPSIGDGHIAKHVHFIFTRALRKWREDVELHRAHAEFARSVGSWGRLGRIFAEALQVHPKEESLWIEAASHEFFGPPSLQSDPNYDPDDPTDPRNAKVAANLGGSVRSARVLLQRGLRANPTSRELWWQHFGLELHYVQKLRGRREILRLGLKGGADGEGGFMEKGEDDGEEEGEGEGAVSDAVPLVVYHNAIKAVPNDVAFRLRFVDLSRQFPETERLRRTILRTIERDFDGNVEAWVARARYAAEGLIMDGATSGFLTAAGDEKNADGGGKEEGSDVEDPVHAVLLEAVRRVPTSKMHLEAIRLVSDQLRSSGGNSGEAAESDGDDDDDRDVENCTSGTADAAFLGRLFDSASSAKVLAGSTDLILARADYLLATGDARGAADSLRLACLGWEGACKSADGGKEGSSSAVGADARIWLRWADLLARLESSHLPESSCLRSAEETPEDVLRLALERVPVRDPGHGRIAAALLRRLLLPPLQAKMPPKDLNGGSAKTRRRRLSDRRRRKEASVLLERILILSEKSWLGTTGPGVVVAETPADLCLSLLRSASLRGGIDAARAAYEPVLFRSGYAGSCGGMSEEEVRSMAAFFEACLCLEKSAASARVDTRSSTMSDSKESAASRRCIGRIYDGAIAFFREGGNVEGANHYRHKKGMDRALLR